MDALLTLPQLSAFLVAAVLITLAPGPDNLMVLSLGVARGREAGIAFGLGCALGCLSHTALAALGISALIAASAGAFAALKLAGGLYLVWLGAQAIRNARPFGTTARELPADGAAKLFAKGLVANAVNPKVILFFLAFLPQFVAAGRSPGVQIVQLGLAFTLQAALIFAAIGWFAGIIGQWLQRRPAIGAWLDRLAGGIFVLLGLRLIAAR
ncbi:LysE family translocator [Sulfurisoma sediminicola]|uniref:Threonine/homoserine/homoserine lactone efflux protein n=1 Tax=Sulfurisoma sediminicola TaxID=1381557 RepID=A0A497X832_9PROT|nr:LysE family translocator [Sulfurisoma sediminicola]RLJ62117.1 threonine/homoserine/homoserine lactone efflux protein [Sulfurisoma sediminicola]